MNTSPPPSAWDHAAILLGAVIGAGAVVLDVFHPLAVQDWGVLAVVLAGLGYKGFRGSLIP